MNDHETEAFVEHVRQVWYADGCDVISVASRVVHVGLPPRFDVSTFCADISYAPFNATARLEPDENGGMVAICTLHDGDDSVSETQTRIGPTLMASVLAVLLFGIREWCGGFDECFDAVFFIASNHNASL